MQEELHAEIRTTFDMFHDVTEPHGSLNPRDLRCAMRAMGFEPRKEEVGKIFEELDKNSETGTVDGEEFFNIMCQRLESRSPVETHQKAFQLIDEGETGYIGLVELRRVAISLGEDVDDNMFREMILSADLDRDGKLNVDEFLRVMAKSELK